MAVERKYERDIGLLLAEELLVSPDFAEWFVSRTRFSGSTAKIHDVRISHSDASGESDLVVIFERAEGGRFACLVEIKIDAPFMPDQHARYQVRAKTWQQRGDYTEYEVILCSPQRYRDESEKAALFETFISYEMISAALLDLDSSPRGKYRSEFLATAKVRSLNNWRRNEDPATNEFWSAAYDIASHEFPILEMKPLKVTKDSTWINFHPRDFPNRPKVVGIYFKGSHGNIDLTFPYTTAYKFAELVSATLPRDMTVHQTGASAAIRIAVDGFNISDGLESGMPRVRIAFKAAERLIKFYRANREALDRAANAATAVE